MRYRLAAIVAVVGLAGGCAEQGGRAFAPNTTGSSAAVLGQVDAVARAFALGMTQPGVRDAVRDAMRTSPWTEHKLSLHEFVATPPGELLLQASAAAVGIDRDALQARIAGLPDLDFYVPARQQRLTWRSTASYLVAVNLDGRAPTFGYDARGRAMALDLTRPEPPAQTVLMLQTAEVKTRRIRPQPNLSGLTIQAPDDGELGGELVMRDATGLTRTIELADLVGHGSLAKCFQNCDSEGGGGGGGSPPPETFLTRIQTQGIVDNNNPFESNEFEFNATAWDGSTGFLRITGIPSTTDQVRHDHLIYAIPSSEVSRINTAVKETDGWPNPDDHFYFVPAGNTYCGPVPLGLNEKGAGWALTEDACSFNPKLGLYFGW